MNGLLSLYCFKATHAVHVELCKVRKNSLVFLFFATDDILALKLLISVFFQGIDLLRRKAIQNAQN